MQDESPQITVCISTWTDIRPNLMIEIINLIEAGLCSSILIQVGSLLPRSRNEAVINFQKHPVQTSHMLFLDSDMAGITPEVISALLLTNSDIVSPVMTARKPPFMPCIGFTKDYTSQDFLNSYHCKAEDRPVIDVDFTGLGCTLVKTEIFKKLPFPWFTTDRITRPNFDEEIRGAGDEQLKLFQDKVVHYLANISDELSADAVSYEIKQFAKDVFNTGVRLGKGHAEGTGPAGEDVNFCRQARRYGATVRVHTGIHVKHIGSTAYHIGDHLEFCRQPDLVSRMEQLNYVWRLKDD